MKKISALNNTTQYTLQSGEATDQDMLAPDLLPHPPQTR